MSEVFKAINGVQADLSKIGISKDREGHNFKFRGIDDVLNALSNLLAKHQLVIVPKVTDRTVSERQSRNGGIIFYVTVTVEYSLISAKDGSTVTATVCGEAMDHSDKATNKAMSAAYKYMAFQAFCIPVIGVDSEEHSHEVIARNVPQEIESCQSLPELQGVWSTLTKAEHQQFKDLKDRKKAQLGPESIPDFLTPQAE